MLNLSDKSSADYTFFVDIQQILRASVLTFLMKFYHHQSFKSFFITLMRKFDIFLNILRQISCNENYQHWTCCIRCLLLPPVLSTPSMVALATLFYSVSYCKDSFSFGRYRPISIRGIIKKTKLQHSVHKPKLTHFSFVFSMWRKQR